MSDRARNRRPAQKEGLQAAIDFTKYLLTLSGGAIAFIIQPSFYQVDILIKLFAFLATVTLGSCVISGLFVFSRGSVMLAEGTYSLEDRYIKIPGQINIFSFAAGFICAAICVLLKAVH
jgi:hypothetical protein